MLQILHNVFSLKFKRRLSRTAFSLLELSIVVLIIGVLIGSVISAKAIIKKARISSARAITNSSPVAGMPNLVVWLESSLEKSFDSEESSHESSLSGWTDIKPSMQNPNNSAVVVVGSDPDDTPEYSNTINGIQAVKFHGADDSYIRINGDSLNGSEYTIIVLEKRQSDGTNYFLEDDGSETTDNSVLKLGYSSENNVVHSQGSGNEYISLVGDYEVSQNPRLFTFVSDSVAGKKTYVNGYIAQESSDTTLLSNIVNLRIGKGYTGEIGEIIIFNRALKREERQATEAYLQKKWKINNISKASESCVIGKIKDSGCDLSEANCVTTTITGTTDTPKTVSAGTDFFGCNDPDYTGTINYTCIEGVFATSDSCTPAAPCSVNTFSGSTTAVSTAHGGTGSITCDDDNFDGSTITYSCSNNVMTATSSPSTCQCADHFVGASCNACDIGYVDISTNTDCSEIDVAGGYVDDGSGDARLGNNCSAGLAITGSSSTSAAKNHLETGTVTCSGTGYDSATSTEYACNDGSIVINSPCGCDTDSGYVLDTDTSTCQQQCSFTGVNAVNGILTTTASVNPGTGLTQSCNNSASGFDSSDSITFNCSGGSITVTGSTACDTCVSGYYFAEGTCKENLVCTGGTEISDTNVSGRKVHVFKTSGTFSCTSGDTTNDLKYILVGGGGAGGAARNHMLSAAAGGGGGGGGTTILSVGQTLTASSNINVSVAGTAAGTGYTNGANGGASTLSGSIVASAGGGGGGGSPGWSPGHTCYSSCSSSDYGGGGGGAGGYNSGSGQSAGHGSPYGYSGSNGTSSSGGSGGSGGSNIISNSLTTTDLAPATFGHRGSGGSAGGSSAGSDGAANSGYGGNGGSGNNSTSRVSGNGGSGIAIFSYPYNPN